MLGAEEFAGLLDPLGPWERRPRLAVAVSGGADSLALAVLGDGWAQVRGGDTRGLIVDHGLRDTSAAEAEMTQSRLAGRGIAASILTLRLARGPALAARARAARYAALQAACVADGRLHLLLGHHAADQAETVMMRLLAGSGPAGLAAMPALAETEYVRLLRPLLTVPPARLRATLVALGTGWVDDPSNADPTTQRARLRALRRDRDGTGPATSAAVAAATARGGTRAAAEHRTAALLARRVRLAPEGFALISPGELPPQALAQVLRVIAGGTWSPAAVRLRAGTLGGAQILPAGRLLAGGWLVVREAAAMAPPLPARPGVRWDGRFRLGPDDLPGGATLGALGDAAVGLRRLSDLPAAVLRALPALRLHGELVTVPHLGYCVHSAFARCRVAFAPITALTAAPFRPPTMAAPRWDEQPQ